MTTYHLERAIDLLSRSVDMLAREPFKSLPPPFGSNLREALLEALKTRRFSMQVEDGRIKYLYEQVRRALDEMPHPKSFDDDLLSMSQRRTRNIMLEVSLQLDTLANPEKWGVPNEAKANLLVLDAIGRVL